jgi:hypothetical protein
MAFGGLHATWMRKLIRRDDPALGDSRDRWPSNGPHASHSCDGAPNFTWRWYSASS